MNTFPRFSPLKRRTLSGLTIKQRTYDSCLVSILIGMMTFCPWTALLMGHRRRILSQPPEANRVPSSENSIAAIEPPWPVRSRQLNLREWSIFLRWTAKQVAANPPDALMERLRLGEYDAAVTFVIWLSLSLSAICFFCKFTKWNLFFKTNF